MEKLKKSDIPYLILLILLAVIFLFPIALVLMNSFKGKFDIMSAPFALPNSETFVGFENYVKGLSSSGFFGAFARSDFYHGFLGTADCVMHVNDCLVYSAVKIEADNNIVLCLRFQYDSAVPDGYVYNDLCCYHYKLQ